MDITGGGTPIGNLVQHPEDDFQQPQQPQQAQQPQQNAQPRPQARAARAAQGVQVAECPAQPGFVDILRCSSLNNVSYMTILLIFLVCGISISSMRYTRTSMPQSFLSSGERGMVMVHALLAAVGFVVVNGVINPPA